MRYERVLSRLCNTPLLLSKAKFDIITSNVTLKLLANEDISSLEESVNQESYKQYLLAADAALKSPIIPVFDSLVSKNGAGDSGVTSYESIMKNTKLLIERGFKDIYFYVGSNGGEAAGLFGLTNFIKSLPSKYGVRTIGFTDDYANSAAYAILAATQKVYATETSELGSIGTIAMLVDLTKKDAKDGIEFKIIRSKDEKHPYNPHEGITAQTLSYVEKAVFIMDEAFNNVIHNYRPNLSIEDIKNLKGASFFGKEALSLGLVDELVGSIDDILPMTLTSSKTISIPPSNKGVSMTLEEALAENVKLSAEITNLKSTMSLATAKATKEEQDRILSILEAQKTFSLGLDASVKCIKTNMTTEAVVSMFEMVKEQVQLNNPIPTQLGVTPSIDPNKNAKDKKASPFSQLLSDLETLEA